MRITIEQAVPEYKGYAAARARGLYNVDPQDGRCFQLEAVLPIGEEVDDIPRDWQIGVVVGPSGSGKSSIGRSLVEHGSHYGRWRMWSGGRWPKDQPVIEVLASNGNFTKATAAMSAVGLGSVPSWLRPHQVLSTGEAFRADMAKLVLSSEQRVVVDEFTSVLDRRVAQVGAGAFAKAWRKGEGRQAILLTPHYDVLEWLEPDWVLDTAGGEKLAAEEERKVIVARKGDFQAAEHRTRYSGDKVGTVEC